MAKDQYKYGRKKEQKVADSLRKRGASVQVSPGSKGPVDLVAKFPSGTRWNVQVKSTRSGEPSSPSAWELGRLKQSATKTRGTAVIANVDQKGIAYKSARSGRTLRPPKSKK